MNGIHFVCERVGDGKSPNTAHRPWFERTHNIFGWAGAPIEDEFVGNVFAEDQAVLDAIAADARTEFAFPIDVDGTSLDYSDIFEIPPQMRGKIISWCAQTFGAEFGQWVATSAKNRRFMAQEVMRKASGVPTADPLNGFRVYWE